MDSRPIVLGRPDGQVRSARTLARFRGLQAGRECLVTGTDVDLYVGSFIELSGEDDSSREAPRPTAEPDDNGTVSPEVLDDLDQMGHPELKQLAAELGLDDRGNATTLRHRIRTRR